MKPTMRNNGMKMVTVKVEHHLSIEMLTDTYIARHVYSSCQAIIEKISSEPKKSILNDVTNELRMGGFDSRYLYNKFTKDEKTAMHDAMKKKFPEFKE